MSKDRTSATLPDVWHNSQGTGGIPVVTGMPEAWLEPRSVQGLAGTRRLGERGESVAALCDTLFLVRQLDFLLPVGTSFGMRLVLRLDERAKAATQRGIPQLA